MVSQLVLCGTRAASPEHVAHQLNTTDQYIELPITCCWLSLTPTLVLSTTSCLQRPRKAYPSELTQFHTQEYVKFLAHVCPDNVSAYNQEMREHNFNEDCPVFDGLFDFCR